MLNIDTKSIVIVLESLFKSDEHTIKGRTRIQKLIYILQQVYGVNSSFDFIPYYYGPYSFDLNNIIQKLIQLGLIIEEENYSRGITRYDISLTEEGIHFLEQFKEFVKDEIDKIDEGLNEMSQLSLDTLVLTAKSIMSKSSLTEA